MKTPRISYREWLHRKPTPSAPAPAVPEDVRPAPVAPPAPEAPPAAAASPGPDRAPAATVDASPAPPLELEPAPAAPPRAPEHEAATPAEAVEHLVFRLGRELFAVPLDMVEEALDIDRIQRIPEMSATMLGVLTLRGSTVPLYAPSVPLGVPGTPTRAALIFVRERGTVALAVDDVDDVLAIEGSDIQRSPLDFGDGVLLGVVRRGAELVGVLDADALIAACRAEPALETA